MCLLTFKVLIEHFLQHRLTYFATDIQTVITQVEMQDISPYRDTLGSDTVSIHF